MGETERALRALNKNCEHCGHPLGFSAMGEYCTNPKCSYIDGHYSGPKEIVAPEKTYSQAEFNAGIAGAYAAAAKHRYAGKLDDVFACECGYILLGDYRNGKNFAIQNWREHIRALTPADARQGQPERAINIYTSAIIKSDGKFLLIHHSNDEHVGSPVWLMPGGKPEPNESASDCLIRECREELGIELRDLSFHAAFRKVLKGKEWVGLFFNVGSFSGTPVIKEPSKHSGFAWMTLEEMKQAAVNQPEMGIAQYLAFSPHAAIASAEAQARADAFEKCCTAVSATFMPIASGSHAEDLWNMFNRWKEEAAARTPDSTKERQG